MNDTVCGHGATGSHAVSPTGWRGVHPADRAAVPALLALVLLVFRQALDGSLVFFERDIGFYWYPQVGAVVRALGEGAWPVWSPRFGFGAPMWADASHQIAYPFTWLNLLFLPPAYYTLFVVTHVWITAVGSYALARRVGLAPLACFAGAAAWCLSGPFLSATNLYHHFAAAAWMPWALFALEGALTKGRGTVFLGVTVALMMLAGSGDVVLMAALLSMAWAGAWVAGDSGLVRSRLLVAARVGALAAVVGAALSAVQWIPMLAQLGQGSRLAFLPADNLFWSVHPVSLVDLVVPRLIADLPLRFEARGWLFDGREPFLSTLYLGVPALVAGLFAALHPRRRLRLFAATSVVFFVLLALGSHTPLLPLLLHLKPMALFRYPCKYLFAAAAAWGLLVALGIDVWLRPWTSRERRYAAWVGLFLLIAGAALLAVASHPDLAPGGIAGLVEAGREEEARAHVSFRLSAVAWMSLALAAAVALRAFAPRGEWTAVALVVLLASNLVGIARTVFLLAPRALMERRPPAAAVIAEGGPGRRVYAMNEPLRWVLEHRNDLAPGSDPEWWWFAGAEDRLSAPSASRWGIDGSFDLDFTGLVSSHVKRLASRLEELVDPRARARLLRIGAVDHVVGLMPPVVDGARVIATLPSIFTVPVVVYAVHDPLPRAYVVGRALPVPDALGVDALLDPAFDPRREVLVPADAQGLPGGEGFEGRVRELERRSDRIVFDVETSGEGLVVAVEAWAPEWRAEVDGRPAAVLRANTAFRAVRVPAGRHRVEMAYRPGSVRLGLAVTSVSVLALLVGWEVRRRRPPLPA